jgi:hypothetical protein
VVHRSQRDPPRGPQRITDRHEERADLAETHSSIMSTVHGQTVGTLRRFGGEPFIALPYRT